MTHSATNSSHVKSTLHTLSDKGRMKDLKRELEEKGYITDTISYKVTTSSTNNEQDLGIWQGAELALSIPTNQEPVLLFGEDRKVIMKMRLNDMVRIMATEDETGNSRRELKQLVIFLKKPHDRYISVRRGFVEGQKPFYVDYSLPELILTLTEIA